MSAIIATPALREMLLALRNGEIRRATVARAECAEEFLLLSDEDQRALRYWLGNGRPHQGDSGVVKRLLAQLFPR